MGDALDFGSIGEESREIVQVGTMDLDVIRPKFAAYKAEAVRIAAEAKALTVSDQDSLNRAVFLGGSVKKIAAKVETQRKAINAPYEEFIDGVNKICAIITDVLVMKKNSKKEVVNPDNAENVLKEKIGQHQAKVELDRREAERKAREATEALQRKLQAEADEANRKAAGEARRRVEAEQKIKREKEAVEARERGAKQAELEALARAAEIERQTALKWAEEQAAKIAVVAPTVVAPVVQEAPKVTRTESGSAFSKNPWLFREKKPEELKAGEDLPREYMTQDDKKIREAIKMGVREIPTLVIYQGTQINFRT